MLIVLYSFIHTLIQNIHHLCAPGKILSAGIQKRIGQPPFSRGLLFTVEQRGEACKQILNIEGLWSTYAKEVDTTIGSFSFSEFISQTPVFLCAYPHTDSQVS